MTTTDDTTTGSDRAVVGDEFGVAFGRIAAELDALAPVPAWRLSGDACQARVGEAFGPRARVGVRRAFDAGLREEVDVDLPVAVVDRRRPAPLADLARQRRL